MIFRHFFSKTTRQRLCDKCMRHSNIYATNICDKHMRQIFATYKCDKYMRPICIRRAMQRTKNKDLGRFLLTLKSSWFTCNHSGSPVGVNCPGTVYTHVGSTSSSAPDILFSWKTKFQCHGIKVFIMIPMMNGRISKCYSEIFSHDCHHWLILLYSTLCVIRIQWDLKNNSDYPKKSDYAEKNVLVLVSLTRKFVRKAQ